MIPLFTSFFNCWEISLSSSFLTIKNVPKSGACDAHSPERKMSLLRPGSARAKCAFLDKRKRRESVWNTHFVLYANNEPKSCLHYLGDCRDNQRNSQSVFLMVARKTSQSLNIKITKYS